MSNPGISLTAPDDYVSQVAQAQRQQALAQALQQSANEPIQAQSAGGITAPISPLSVLAKALNSFGGTYEAGQAARTQAAARQADLANATKTIQNLYTLPAVQGSPGATAQLPGGQTITGPTIPTIPGRPTTPQEQIQTLAPLAAGGPTSQAVYGSAMPGVMANLNLQQKVETMRPQLDQMLSGMGDSPLKAATIGLFNISPEAGLQFAAQHAASQKTLVAPLDYPKYGIDPKTVPPGEQIYRDASGNLVPVKLGDVKSPAAQKQAVEQAGALATARMNAQTANNVPADGPAIANYAANIHSGMVTLRSIPMAYRTAVSDYLANEKDPLGSPTTSALWTGAAKKITEPYTSNPQYQLYANAQPYLERMNAAAAMKSSIGDTDLLDSLVKLETGGNAITEAQVLTSINGQSVTDKLNVLKNKLVEQGGVLSDTQRKEAMDLGNQIYSNYKNGYAPLYKMASQQLSAAKIPQAYWTIPDLNQLGAPGLGNPGNGGATPAPSTGWGAATVVKP